MSITRDVIFDEAIKQGHAANSVPYHDSDSESDADDPAAAVKEEADTAAEVVAKEAVEEEGQETTAAAPEHRYHLCLTKKDSVSNPRLRSLGRLCKLHKLTLTLYSSI